MDDKGRLVVVVSTDTYRRVVELADRELRTPSQQAAWLLRRAVEQVARAPGMGEQDG